jgi:hypothetical protein
VSQEKKIKTVATCFSIKNITKPVTHRGELAKPIQATKVLVPAKLGTRCTTDPSVDYKTNSYVSWFLRNIGVFLWLPLSILLFFIRFSTAPD